MKDIKAKVLEKLALGKTYVDKVLIEPIKKLAKTLKELSNETELQEAILYFFKDLKLDTEKQAYVLVTLVQTYDLQFKSPVHKKVLKDLAKKNTFVDIIF